MEEIDKGESWIKSVNALIKTCMPDDGIKITGISAEDISNQFDKAFIDIDELDSRTIDDLIMEHRCVSSAVSTSTRSRPSNPFIDDWKTGANINNVHNLPALTPVSKPKRFRRRSFTRTIVVSPFTTSTPKRRFMSS